MAVTVKDWLDGVVGNHKFTPKKTYGSQNSNIVFRLQRPLVLKSFTGPITIGEAGTEVCIFRGYESGGSYTLATIFEADKQVSIRAGGEVWACPYPSGTVTE